MSVKTNKAGIKRAAIRPASKIFFTVLVLVTFIGPLSLHLFFPSTPAVKADFGVDDSLAQFTVSAPMFVMAFMTLVFGSLADRLGRRRVLIWGILLFSLGGALSAAAGTIWVLIAGRLVQAAGGACGTALARVIARDVYGADRLVRAIAYLTMGYSLGPIIAPPIGGFMVEMSGWRSVLILASVAGLVIAGLVYFVIAETQEEGEPGYQPRSFLADYFLLFRNIRFSSLVVQVASSTGSFFALATGAAFIMIEYLGRPASEYGLYFPLMPGGYLLGNFVSSRLGARVSIETMVFASSGVMMAAMAGFAMLTFAGLVSPLTLFVPGCLLTFGQGMSTPYAQAGLLRVPPNLTGTASGVGSFAGMMGGAVLSQVYGFVADGTPIPLAVIVAVATLMAFAAAAVPFYLKTRSA